MMVLQGNFKGAWTLKINCNKHCWTKYISLLKKKISVEYLCNFPILHLNVMCYIWCWLYQFSLPCPSSIFHWSQNQSRSLDKSHASFKNIFNILVKWSRSSTSVRSYKIHLFRERPFNLKVFLKKYSDSQCCWKIFWFWWRKKK